VLREVHDMHVSVIVHFLFVFFVPVSLVSAVKAAVVFEGPIGMRSLLYLIAIYSVYLFVHDPTQKDIHAFEHPLIFAVLSFLGLKYSFDFASRVFVLISFRLSAAVFRAALNSPGSLLVPLAMTHALLPLGFLAVNGKPVTKNAYHLFATTLFAVCLLGERPNLVQVTLRLVLSGLPVVYKLYFGRGVKSSPVPLHVELGKSAVFIEPDRELTIIDEDVLIGEIHDIVEV
jgi:hypothetical protein